MDSSSCDIYQLSSLLRSLTLSQSEPLPRVVIFLIAKLRKAFSQLSFVYVLIFLQYISYHFLLYHHLNLPLTITHRTLSRDTTSGLSRHGSDGKDSVLQIAQISNISGASLLDFFLSYQDTRWRSITGLLRFSRCILQPQLTGLLLC